MTVRGILLDRSRPPKDVDVDHGLARSLKGDQLLWIDVMGGAEEMGPTAEVLELPALLLPRTNDRETATLVRENGWIRLTAIAIQAPGRDISEPIVTMPLHIVAGRNVVVTIRGDKLDAIDALKEQFRDEPGLGVLDAADLVAGIVDEVLAIYFRHVEAIERRVDVLDELAIRGRSAKDYLGEVVGLRRRTALLRRSLAPHREAFGPLARPDFEVAALGRPWPGLVQRLDATTLAIQNVRELLVGSVALQQSGTSERANDVMKRLTIVNAVLLPAVVLAGVMGMNFPMPFFQQAGNFWVVIATMVGLAVAILVVARVRGWI